MKLKQLKCLLHYSLLLFCVNFYAQASSQPKIIIKPIVKADNSVDFNYEKASVGSFIVEVNFSKLSNAQESEKQIANVNANSGLMFKLKPIDKSKKIDFAYSYSLKRGFLDPKIDSSEVYFLPFEKDKKITISEVFRPGVDTKKWKAYVVYSKTQDTVFAMRKGQVVEIRSPYTTIKDDTSGELLTIEKKEIIVEHTDGTFASYFDIDAKSIQVKTGDFLSAHQPIGLMNKSTGKNNSSSFNTIFKIFYYSKENTKMDSQENIVDANFLTKNGVEKLENKKQYIVAVQ